MSHITPCCTVIENAAIALYHDGHRQNEGTNVEGNNYE